MAITTPTNIDYLIPFLRLELGDMDSTKYRYIDSWLRTALVMAVKNLQSWWNDKYLLDSNYNVYRNPRVYFEYEEPPIIQDKDENAIILMASIIIREGSLENAAWDFGSWRDAEIAYSNIESSKSKNEGLRRAWNRLLSIIKPPQKRLSKSRKSHLQGYLNNEFEG